ncbi:hypothetical protein TRIUR3_26497 [Triticum urartu]|uniref:Pre-mRNA-splicing factor 38 n=1 Tax=Triticum urartu TaxID=4572 RepID=M7YQW6_TRIUA|nr:hypothetical protein TRIUR3_26497 [Triticum urartu]
MELDHTGGTHDGNRRPPPFLCLALKVLQIQPNKEIVLEFIKNEDYKYVRVLGAFYLRLTGTVADVYQYLEPLYNDYRKISQKLSDGTSRTLEPRRSALEDDFEEEEEDKEDGQPMDVDEPNTHEKNFVGLSITDGYIDTGSETNEIQFYRESSFSSRIFVTTTKMQEHTGSGRSCLWHTLDFADYEFKNNIFAIRFGSVESEH